MRVCVCVVCVCVRECVCVCRRVCVCERQREMPLCHAQILSESLTKAFQISVCRLNLKSEPSFKASHTQTAAV